MRRVSTVFVDVLLKLFEIGACDAEVLHVVIIVVVASVVTIFTMSTCATQVDRQLQARCDGVSAHKGGWTLGMVGMRWQVS